MFQRARLKLTAWYLGMVMLVSIGFSFGMYSLMTDEIKKFTIIHRNRIGQSFDLVIVDDSDLINDLQSNLAQNLILVNGFILVVSGGLAFFIAGRTLQPIKKMADEQKRFISDSSHELRTPLAAMKSTLEVYLRDKNMKLKEAKEVLHDNLLEVDRLCHLSNSLLKLSGYTENKSLTFTVINLKQVVETVVKRCRGLATTKNIILRTNLAKIDLRGDQASLTELVTILMDNAIKYSYEGGTVACTLKRRGADVIMSVADDGIGVRATDIPHLFDRFYQADKSRHHDKESGYGLGLAIAKQIVLLHHGSITVTSKLNQGSVFTVKLSV